MKRLRKLCILAVVLVMLLSSLTVSASSLLGSSPYENLGTLIVAGKETTTSSIQIVDLNKPYTAVGGGVVKYSDLVSSSYQSTGYVVEGNFELLTSSAKREFLGDLMNVAESARQANSDITNDTLTTWNQCLQTCKGVDAQLIAVLMRNTKPDFISAMKVYAPFQSPVSTVLGVVTIVMLSLLTLSTLLDMFYIGVPLFNTAISGDSKEKPGVISPAAYHAYLEEVNASGGSGSNGKTSFKSAVGIYFKRRSVILILMFVCLLYLVSGQIWDLVADAMTLFGGVK